MLEPGAVEPGAREREHVEREIQSEPALDLRPEQLEDSAGAGAEIEQRARRRSRKRGADRRLHGFVGHVQLADAVPLRGVATEIGLRRRSALCAHGGEPLAVAGERWIGGIEPGDKLPHQPGRPLALAQAKERPRALAEAVDQPGLRQEPQMPRDARLRLAQDLGEIGYRQLGFREQCEDPQAGRLARGLQGAVERIEREQVGWRMGRRGHDLALKSGQRSHSDPYRTLGKTI